ncbi:MAG: 50S ribosomal protein L9 [Alphaproteobacteria bacterium]|jgi:large subunit ribosomal protein L9|nr:50S ribosomal protein L9 [Alphaproteobacteria bacterium]
MDVILLERVEKLGQMGDVVKVKDGYARNYLLPRQKALRATKQNLTRFESGRVELETQNLERRNEAEAVAGKMDGTRVVLVRQASDMGQLYGSVSARDVAEALAEAGFQTGRQQVVMDRPIKTLGIHSLKVVLHPEVAVTVEANVARSEAEAEQQEAEAFFESPELAAAALEGSTTDFDDEPLGEVAAVGEAMEESAEAAEESAEETAGATDEDAESRPPDQG